MTSFLSLTQRYLLDIKQKDIHIQEAKNELGPISWLFTEMVINLVFNMSENVDSILPLFVM